MEKKIRCVVATDIRRAEQVCVQPITERQDRAQLVEDDTIRPLGPVRHEIAQETLRRQVVEMLDEPEIVAKEVVVAADRLQTHDQTQGDGHQPRPPCGPRG